MNNESSDNKSTLNKIVKRKILESYNISAKTDSTPKQTGMRIDHMKEQAKAEPIKSLLP